MDSGLSFYESEAYAHSKGGRLPTRVELQNRIFMQYGGKPIFPGENLWVTVKNYDGTKDYI